MGSEWGQFLEWRYNEGLEWVDLEDEMNHKMQHFTAVLNNLYEKEASLWELEDTSETIELIDADNTEESVLTFMRRSKNTQDFLIIALNLVPVERKNFAIGVPFPGSYKEVLNTEKIEFGGTWTKDNLVCQSVSQPFKGFDQQIQTILPALGALIIKPEKIQTD
ncbi:hypothetical protein GCM10025857_60600 [Alicyclobacillus contaminans]|nr:hypothetical protein GCM10025857_60600 [Alicyclobacillus contaminans]